MHCVKYIVNTNMHMHVQFSYDSYAFARVEFRVFGDVSLGFSPNLTSTPPNSDIVVDNAYICSKTCIWFHCIGCTVICK